MWLRARHEHRWLRQCNQHHSPARYTNLIFLSINRRHSQNFHLGPIPQRLLPMWFRLDSGSLSWNYFQRFTERALPLWMSRPTVHVGDLMSQPKLGRVGDRSCFLDPYLKLRWQQGEVLTYELVRRRRLGLCDAARWWNLSTGNRGSNQ